MRTSLMTHPFRFYLITVEIEARGAASVVPMMLAMDAINRHLEEDRYTPSENLMQFPSFAVSSDDAASEDEVEVAVSVSLLSQSSSVDEFLNDVPDERLMLPGGVVVIGDDQHHDEVEDEAVGKKKRSNSDGTMSRRKRGARPKARPAEGGRYLLSSLAPSSPKKLIEQGSSRKRSEAFPPNDALVGNLTADRVAEYVTMQLERVSIAVKGMCDSLASMKEGCHPFIFYHRVRPFLSAWKQVITDIYPIHTKYQIV
jgi:hypothetical protein